MNVSDAMSGPVWTIGPATTAIEAITAAREHGTCHAVVAQNATLLGVACVHDLADVPADAPVSSAMKSPARFIDADASLDDADSAMKRYDVGILVAFAGDQPVGVISRGDLARAAPGAYADYRCLACGGAHHVRHNINGVPLCGDCGASTHAPSVGFDLGAGD